MRIELGPRDEERFASVEESEREYLAFLIDFCLGILAKRPNQPEALSSAASALTALGYYEDGLRCDRRLAHLWADNAVVIYNLACSLALTQNTEEALETLERAIRLGYSDDGQMMKDADLASLRGLPRFVELACRAQTQAEDGSRGLP